MAAIAEYIEFTGKVPTCSLCGARRADAVWRGPRDLFVCQLCAEAILPRIQADTLAGQIRYQGADPLLTIEGCRQRLQGEFNRTMILHLSTVIRDLRRKGKP